MKTSNSFRSLKATAGGRLRRQACYRTRRNVGTPRAVARLTARFLCRSFQATEHRYITTFIGALLLAAPAFAAPLNAPLVAPYRQNIKLDGDFKDWRGANWTCVTPQNGVFDTEATPTTDPNDLSFRFAVCHDDDALYIAVETRDNAVWADSTPPTNIEAPAWDDDAIEIFIDGNHNRAPDARAIDDSELKFGGEFSIVANGAATSQFSGFPRTFGKAGFWQGATNWKRLKQSQPGLIRTEFRLTWKVMGGQVRPGDSIGFTLAAQDDDDGGGREHSLYWKAGSLHGWQNEGDWGTLYLQPKPRKF